MKFTRRDTIFLAAAATTLGLCGVSTAHAAEGDMVDVAKLMAPAGGFVDFPIGSESAPVTIIEYASPTCPHCAAFHNNVYAGFKAAFIDTGKVKFIVRPFMRGGQAGAIDAAIFMLAEAAGAEHYHNVIETYFRTQNEWIQSDKIRDALQAIALQLGLTSEQFEATLSNVDGFNTLVAVRDQALNEFGLEGTPTFYVNGKTVSGDKSLEQLAAEIDPLVPADFVAPAAAPQPTPAPVAPPAADAAPAEPVAAQPAGPAVTP